MRTHHAAAPGHETDESGGVVWQAPFSWCRARLAAAAERLHERSVLAVVPPKASDAPVLALYRVKVIAETLAVRRRNQKNQQFDRSWESTLSQNKRK
ncbi:hypothetical protein DIPPA_30157 [Diplonema papillatum]|nr:hypothetical protein DIPPA_30157 [Diplonema papillatum]